MDSMDRVLADVTEYLSLDPLRVRLDTHRRYSEYPDDVEGAVLDVAKISQVDDVLDIGSGTGSLLRRLKAGGHTGRLVGLDISAAAVGELAGTPGIEAYEGDAAHLPFDGGTFQTAFARHMLYHVPDVPAAIAEVRRILTTGGKFVASVNHPFATPKTRDLVIDVVTKHGFNVDSGSPFSVHSDNLAEIMAVEFDDVNVQRYDNALVFNSPEPVISFCIAILSFYGVGQDSPLRSTIAADIRASVVKTFASNMDSWIDPKGYCVFLARKGGQ
jgi:ubiquinone/menaquinone biosynthesis C-methylase UbiE